MGSNTRYLYEKIKRYRLDKRSALGRNALSLIELGLMTEDLAAGYLLIMRPMIAQAERFPNYLERPPEHPEIYPNGLPPLIIGTCREGDKVAVGLFPCGAVHTIFGGTTGAGKTVGIRRLLKAVRKYNQTHDDKIVVICLDRKNDYLDLFTILGPDCVHFDVHGGLKVGLQNPPGLPVNVWVNHIATIFSARAGLIAGWVTLADLMNWLVGVMNPKTTSQPLFPDFQLLLDVAERLPKLAVATKGMYQEALVQMLRAVVLAMGPLFAAFHGLDVERDLISQGRSAVISMPNFEPPWLSHFFIDLIVSQLLMGRIHRGHRVDKLEVLLVLDEADDDVSRASEAVFPQGYMSPLARVLRQGREFGIGVVLGLGSLGPASEHILNSATYHFLFRMGDAKCRKAAADTLQLPNGADALIPTMPPGVCLSRTPAWPESVLTDIEYVAPCRDVEPTYTANPHVPSKRLDEMPEILQAIEKRADDHGRQRQRQERLKHKRLRSEARELLKLAAQHPFWPVARLYDLMGVPTPAVQKEIRKQLLLGEYAEIQDVRVGRKNLALIELGDAAWRFLDLPPTALPGRGKLAHKTFAGWIKMVGEQWGYEAKLEWRIPGTTHDVDVAWLVDGKWQVFEVVVTCEDNLEGHLRAALLTPRSPVESVTIVAPQKSTLEVLKKRVASFEDSELFEGKVKYQSVDTFEKELW